MSNDRLIRFRLERKKYGICGKKSYATNRQGTTWTDDESEALVIEASLNAFMKFQDYFFFSWTNPVEYWG